MKIKILLLFLVTFLLAGTDIFSQWNLPISVGPFDNYQISTVNGFLETDIIVNPRNPLNFVCTDNRLTYLSGGPPEVFYTTNGGINWSSFNLGLLTRGDPSLAADSLGYYYLSVLQTQGSGQGIQLFKSTNGGASWTNMGIVIPGPAADKEWLAADQTTGPYQNHVYISYLNFAAGFLCNFSRSTNNGANWLTPVTLGSSSTNNNPGPDVAVGPDGNVICAWNAGASSGDAVRVSTDGGATFGPQVTASVHSWPGTLHSSGYYVLKGDVIVMGIPHIAIDMTGGPYRGYIYLVYAANPAGPDNADIFMTRSSDGGATWSSGTPVRVNDDSTTNDQFMCDVSVDAQGRVWVMWLDSRDDPANNLIWTYGAVSTNGGVSFMPNFKISSQSFDPAVVKFIGSNGLGRLGEYMGISGKTFTFPCYIGQNNTRQDFTAYLPDYGMSFALQSDNVPPGGTSWNRVRIPLMGPYSGTVTLTATVSPSPSPGTITFNWSPGNVRTINGSPDSVVLNTVVSATVPTNTYTINVTGTESAGPRTHTRSWTLNVNPIFVGLHNQNNGIPKEYKLEQNYPNPFNPSTVISYQLPVNSFVTLKVYDILGREVASIVNDQLKPGSYEVQWNATDFPGGVYFYKLEAGSFVDTRKMVLVK